MKKTKLFTLLGLGILGLGSLSLGLVKGSTHYSAVRAEGEEDPIVDPVPDPEPEEEVFECSVIIAEAKNGTVTIDKEAGHIGDTVIITVKHDVFYLVESVKVNGTALIEDENIAGRYSFILAEGENKIEVICVIDQALLGELSTMMDQAKNQDWQNLFTIDNLVTLVTVFLNSGILIAVIRYFIKDKRLENKVENKIEEIVPQALLENTKTIIEQIIREYVGQVVSDLKLDSEEIKNALTVFTRCFALAQENTPEARIAITQELSSLNLSDQESIRMVREKLDAFMAQQNENLLNILAKMQKMEDTNKQIIESAGEEPVEANEAATDSLESATNEEKEGEEDKAHPYE